MRDEKIVRIQHDIQSFLENRKTLQLSTVTKEGFPFASYAPFGAGDDCFYVLLSDIARHAVNLVCNPVASVLVIADEAESKELFALERLNYTVDAELLEFGSEGWALGIDCMAARFGKRIHDLSSLADFKLFRLQPSEGRYVKGFAKAYSLEGKGFSGVRLNHLREGHKKREATPA
ncbi:heme utilization protein HutZ [Oleiphilus sp. HI0130]|jgi:putative heme iron utilization protein|nr:heme utilization protein HutZ [Oleiphilus sp. HI0130]KZZ71906.1 heme utilization protein HutZ [Oleiphilus sp. HI0130]